MNERRLYFQVGVACVAIIFIVKLFFMQVVDDTYKLQSESISTQEEIIYPLRGMIFDRNKKLIVNNRPVFDIKFILRDLEIRDTAAFCTLLDIDAAYLRKQLKDARRDRAYSTPYILVKQFSFERFAAIQDRLSDFPGLLAEARTVREYEVNGMANVLGYVREVDRNFLENKDTAHYYRQGDFIGKSGIEAYYEPYLRGKRGVRYVLKDKRGITRGSYKDGAYDTAAVIGKNLYSSVDIDLQLYGEKLMQNKIGAIVAIEPATGEILAMVSSPTYNPSLLSGGNREVARNYAMLVSDPYKPLFNRTIQAPYPPGSTFKPLMALVGLHDGTLDTVHTSFSCSRELVNCHNHPSPTNVFTSIQHSCNPFYVKALRKMIITGRVSNEREDTRLGLQHWFEMMRQFGLGKKLGTDIPYEHNGRIPSPAYYDKYYYEKNWKYSNIYSIGIGQGEVGVVPIQLANAAAVIANRGWYITPHVIKGVGEEMYLPAKFKEKHYTDIAPAYYEYVVRAMAEVVRAGTARRAYMPDLVICGKTGTAQNPHGEDHSIFMAFAPAYQPKIAIAVYVENSGFGGTWAAPIASLMIERFINGEVKRKELEEYIFGGNLLGKQPIKVSKDKRPATVTNNKPAPQAN